MLSLKQNLMKLLEKSSDELRNQIKEEIVTQLHEHMRYSYEKFNSTFEDFKYKYNEQLRNSLISFQILKQVLEVLRFVVVLIQCEEAQNKAKELQRQDRSFHVFVGQVGYWLPWDPCADKVTDEEYFEEELNNMMKKYKENEVARDLLYEEEKRDKLYAMQERLEAEKKQKELQENMEEPDPWLKSKFEDAPEATSETTDPGVQAENTGDESNTTETVGDSTTTEVPTVDSTNEVKEV